VTQQLAGVDCGLSVHVFFPKNPALSFTGRNEEKQSWKGPHNIILCPTEIADSDTVEYGVHAAAAVRKYKCTEGS